ncbi:MAG: hypothetical protein ACR2IF_08495 [Terriglobales bacterium]
MRIHMPSLLHPRALLPRFLLERSVLAWQCSICGKMFALSLDEAQGSQSASVPEHIHSAFDAHDCVHELEIAAERVQLEGRER